MFVPLNEEVAARHAGLVPGTAEAVARLRAMPGDAPGSLVCADDLPEGRRGPLGMYKCFVDLAVYPPSAVLKVDDTEAGIAEGVAAGCPTVSVLSSGNHAGRTEEIAALAPAALRSLRRTVGERLTAAGADPLIDTLADLPALLERLDG